MHQRDVSVRNFGHWSSEIYGLGILYRQLLAWSRIHPLPFTSEHGIPFGTSSLHYASEGPRRSGARPLHLTWNLEVHAEAKRRGILSIRIPHPWSVAWRRGGKKRNVKWNGPLLLVPHSLPQVKPTREREFWVNLLDHTVANEPPAAALISHHDLGGVAEGELLRRHIPIFSLGRATSDLFFDRFYDFVGQFTHVVSPNLSSASFYSTDFGIPFQLIGEELAFDYHAVRAKMGKDAHDLHSRAEFKTTATNLFSTPLRSRSQMLNNQISELVWRELSLDLLDYPFDQLGSELARRRSANLAVRVLLRNLVGVVSRGGSE